MNFLVDNDPMKVKAVSEMPVIDFFMLLNKKIAETKKQIERNRKSGHTG
jgi:hypothetical protein